jgi:2-methylcitrate dehydratase PrpD
MAVGLVDGGAFPAQYTDGRVKNQIITELRGRIDATIDESLAEDAAEVTLTLRDGRVYTERVEHATGAPENPMTDRQLDDKFRALVGNVLSNTRVKRLLASLWDLDQVKDIGAVVKQMRVTPRHIRE